MSKAVLTLQIGQCGNQIGFEFWKNLCLEHGVGFNGELVDEPHNIASNPIENRELFFYQTDNGCYVPRVALMDLEPRVINSIVSSEYSKIFTNENVYLSTEGGGAGNNWAVGYSQASKLNDYLEIIERLAEDADSLDGFLLCHSMAGGTGSGVGSYVLEQLVDLYPKRTIQTFSVFPHQKEMSDVVVQAYNSVLAMERLINFADAVFVLDNEALQRIAAANLQQQNINIHQINEQITKIMNMSTNPLRFPTYLFNSLRSLILPLTPTNTLHFLTTSYAPWKMTITQNMNLQRILRDLLRPCNMTSTGQNSLNINHGFLAILNIIQGEHNIRQLSNAINHLREKQLARFVPWVPKLMQAILVKSSPHLKELNGNSGLMISNHTGIKSSFRCMLEQFDKLRQRKAYLAQYQSTGVFSANFDEMTLARNVVDGLIEEYEAATKEDFKKWFSKEENQKNLNFHMKS